MNTTLSAHRTLPYTALALIVGLAACTSDVEASDDPAANTLVEFLGSGAVEFSPAGGASILLYPGSRHGNKPSEDETQFNRDIQELVETCMERQGFDYVPFVEESTLGQALALPDQEFAERYGYGLALFEFRAPGEPENPNHTIRSRLSEQAQAEYDLALRGTGSGDDPGCYRNSVMRLADDTNQQRPTNEFAELEADLRDLGDRIAADPRLDEPRQAWIDCMADAGYPGLTELWSGRDLVNQRVYEIDGYAEWSRDIAEGEVAGKFSPSASEYHDIQNFEKAVATTDLDCRDVHFNEIFDDVRRDLEAEFVEQHRAELEQARDVLAEIAERP